MTAERPTPQDDDEVVFVLAMTLPLVARSDSSDSGASDPGRVPPEFAAHLSAFDADAASFDRAAAVAPELRTAAKAPR